MSVAISLNNISKAYQLGVFNTGSISSDIARWWALKRGKEDPYLKIGEENDRSSKGQSDIVWSLKDLTFDIQKGESVGIIGRNGAGKSTLLKVLSQITHPTSGQMRLKGKVASLLEVGTGFHPELTGRENVFLNGAILGMRKEEIKRKFDEIVAFSGVERYIDTPVKRYSSGMYVRLAFAVAAHLESDILIVDEVLAVGDAEFQKKCLGKMNDLGNSSGRTILFVSHNMSSIKALCEKSIFLEKGKIQSIGKTVDVISQYLSAYVPEKSDEGFIDRGLSLIGNGDAWFTRFLPVKNNTGCTEFFFGDKPKFLIELQVDKEITNAALALMIVSIYGETIGMANPNISYKPIELSKGKYRLEIVLDDTLMPGDYSFNLSIAEHYSGASIDFIESVGSIKILKDSIDKGIDYPWNVIHGYIKPNSQWEIKKI
jgi:ABC-type polysaccharide/polyol phosphate transport system ATPase subunit